jgi:hypothetical protein
LGAFDPAALHETFRVGGVGAGPCPVGQGADAEGIDPVRDQLGVDLSADNRVEVACLGHHQLGGMVGEPSLAQQPVAAGQLRVAIRDGLAVLIWK